MAKEKNVGSSSQPASASTGTLKQTATGKRAAKRAADCANSAAAEAIAAASAQAETEIMASQAFGGEESSTDEDTPASAVQLRSKTSENAKMHRKIAELEAWLAEKAKATKVTDELRTVYCEIS